MAGEWIKITNELPDKEEVQLMAEYLGLPPPHIVGLLVKFWVWCDRHLVDGCASVAPMFASRYVGEPHFHEALVKVGWIEMVEGGGFRLKNWDRHMSKSAKSRALAAIRMLNSRCAASVTKAQPEKRREEKRRSITTQTADKPPRPSDEVWDFVVARWYPDGVIESQRSAVNGIVRDFKQLLNGHDPSEIGVRADRISRAWGPEKTTARSVVKNWGHFAKELEIQPEPKGVNNLDRV